jgi:hypothetical protein
MRQGDADNVHERVRNDDIGMSISSPQQEGTQPALHLEN